MLFQKIKHKHRNHIFLLLAVLICSIGVLALSILWNLRIINLPPAFVYYARIVLGRVELMPTADVVLPVKFHKQKYSLSCEAATVKTIFDYYGLNVSEEDIISKMPFDSTPRMGNIWGDPHLGFVGKIDGQMMKDGYGIHWEALAVTASHWLDTSIIKNGSAKDLARHISEGRPVIAWGYLGRGQPVQWQTSEGKTIYAVNGEHTRVVYGYKGSNEDPEGFFVMDPTYNRAYWEVDDFMRNWSALGRMGLIIYPEKQKSR